MTQYIGTLVTTFEAANKEDAIKTFWDIIDQDHGWLQVDITEE